MYIRPMNLVLLLSKTRRSFNGDGIPLLFLFLLILVVLLFHFFSFNRCGSKTNATIMSMSDSSSQLNKTSFGWCTRISQPFQFNEFLGFASNSFFSRFTDPFAYFRFNGRDFSTLILSRIYFCFLQTIFIITYSLFIYYQNR